MSLSLLLSRLLLAAATLALANAHATQSWHEPDLRNPEEPVPFLLDRDLRPGITRILPPAPRAGTAAYAADRAVFLQTRQLQDGPRWAQAKRDVKMGVPAMLENFSCAAGASLDPVKTPLLAGLLTRVSADAERAIEPAKVANARQRPFALDDGPVCQPVDELKSFDYPSGHASWGWTIGLLLAELAPDRATQILTRARTYAESRVVCGAHNQSAIDAGALTAASLVAALHGSPEFRAALEAARGEVAQIRGLDGLRPSQAACEVEAAGLRNAAD